MNYLHLLFNLQTKQADFCGRGELASRQQALTRVLSKLSKLASEFNIAGIYPELLSYSF